MPAHMKNQLPKAKIAACAAAAFFAFPLAASALSVSASPAPGAYREAVEVALSPSEPGARVSWGTDPLGSVESMRSYEGPVLLTGSTALNWFAFGQDGSESPISLEKYSIDYSGTFAIAGGRGAEGRVYGIAVRNISGEPLSPRGWVLRSGTGSVPLPAARADSGALVAADDLAWDGLSPLELVSPDGKVRDSVPAARLPSNDAYAPAGSNLAASLRDSNDATAAFAAAFFAAMAAAGAARIPALRKLALAGAAGVRAALQKGPK